MKRYSVYLPDEVAEKLEAEVFRLKKIVRSTNKNELITKALREYLKEDN